MRNTVIGFVVGCVLTAMIGAVVVWQIQSRSATARVSATCDMTRTESVIMPAEGKEARWKLFIEVCEKQFNDRAKQEVERFLSDKSDTMASVSKADWKVATAAAGLPDGEPYDAHAWCLGKSVKIGLAVCQ
jgi:hypothetical protein